MSTMDEEKKLQGSLSNGSAVGQEEEAECAKTSKWILAFNKHKKARIGIGIGIGIVISHLIFGGVLFYLGTLMPLNCPKVAPGECPSYWAQQQGYCYRLSEEEKNWTESQNFCISHNASLAKITKEEMDFSKNVSSSLGMFIEKHVSWIGLKRDSNHAWKWLDGEYSSLEVIGNGGDCAFLYDDHTAASSGSCATEHHFICKKMILRDPERL